MLIIKITAFIRDPPCTRDLSSLIGPLIRIEDNPSDNLKAGHFIILIILIKTTALIKGSPCIQDLSSLTGTPLRKRDNLLKTASGALSLQPRPWPVRESESDNLGDPNSGSEFVNDTSDSHRNRHGTASTTTKRRRDKSIFKFKNYTPKSMPEKRRRTNNNKFPTTAYGRKKSDLKSKDYTPESIREKYRRGYDNESLMTESSRIKNNSEVKNDRRDSVPEVYWRGSANNSSTAKRDRNNCKSRWTARPTP